ncbi:MAG: hypothetical protein ACYC54_11390 [Sedimentisphaerales bacterium]
MEEIKSKNAVIQGTVTGCASALVPSGCLISLGAILCFTGIGAIIGIPLIIIALLAPFFGGLLGLGARKCKCPWCETQISSFMTSKGIDCPACKKRIVIKGKKFIKVE